MPRFANTPSGLVCPAVTLMTDFGLTDWYVAAMKAVLLRFCPSVPQVDVTHLILPGDVLAASITLERTISAFPAGCVHLAVVDPGVGTDRRILIARIRDQWTVCPDNGLITWAWRCHGGGQAHELIWRPEKFGSTFHGRDIMAPAAGMLAAGTPIAQLGRPIEDAILLDIAPVLPPGRTGQIIHIDRFGNCTTNITAKALQAIQSPQVYAKGHNVGPLRRTYADVPSAQALALIGSSDLLEIAVRDGSVEHGLRLAIGDSVSIGCAQ
jgi:S-adenosylmethionine hydrolase